MFVFVLLILATYIHLFAKYCQCLQNLANSFQIYDKERNPLNCNLHFESMMPFNSAQVLILSCIFCLLVSVSKKMSNSLSQNYLNKTLTPGGGILVRELSELLFNNLYCKWKVWSEKFVFKGPCSFNGKSFCLPLPLWSTSINRKLFVWVFNLVNYPSNVFPFRLQFIFTF